MYILLFLFSELCSYIISATAKRSSLLLFLGTKPSAFSLYELQQQKVRS
jgi:hypothetical protein